MTKGKTIHTKQDIPKQRKKINCEEMNRKHINNWMQKKANDFGKKLWHQRKDNGKAEWIKNMTKELEGPEKGPKAEMHIDLHKSKF